MVQHGIWHSGLWVDQGNIVNGTTACQEGFTYNEERRGDIVFADVNVQTNDRLQINWWTDKKSWKNIIAQVYLDGVRVSIDAAALIPGSHNRWSSEARRSNGWMHRAVKPASSEFHMLEFSQRPIAVAPGEVSINNEIGTIKVNLYEASVDRNTVQTFPPEPLNLPLAPRAQDDPCTLQLTLGAEDIEDACPLQIKVEPTGKPIARFVFRYHPVPAVSGASTPLSGMTSPDSAASNSRFGTHYYPAVPMSPSPMPLSGMSSPESAASD